VTSVAGIGTFLLLVRELTITEFAAYSILFALVELVDAISNVGVGQVLSRYVPELYVEHRPKTMRRLIALGLAVRAGILCAFLLAIWLLAPLLAPMIGLRDWEWALKLYLLVVLFRVSTMTLFTILESMLNQGIAQLGFGSVTALRFVLLLAATWHAGLDLHTVIAIELVTDILGFGIMLTGLIRTTPKPADDEEDRPDWIRENARRMGGFGMKGYLQHMLIIPFGSSTNRLLVGGSLGGPEVALFGFAQSVADLMQRYLPVKLLAGVIRPVLTARFVRDRRFSDIELASNLIFKLNAAIVCLAAVVLSGGGRQMIEFVSGGKYGERGLGLLLMMCAGVLLFSHRHMLDHVSNAVERNGPLIWSNAFITLSVIPGIALLPLIGVYALPAANLVGVAGGSWLLIHRLRVEGFDYREDHAGLARLLGATGIGAATGFSMGALGIAWMLSAATSALVFLGAALLLRPWHAHELAVVDEIAGRFRQGRAG
jgi:O-antigen/teichoic acid export membrane protein